ncbi:MAG: lamin tail domain-containing protein [Bacteroidales bacterium]|jgi:hypothetical protein|nr:lamin tail domain-containing protein [Bacteroidales bacterium]
MKTRSILIFSLCFFIYHASAQVFCEDFSLAKVPNSYSTGAFTGNENIVWNYVNARGNQKTTASNNAAISLNKAANACIFSDTVHSGIRSLSFEWEQTLTTNCAANVFINDSCVGTLISTAQQKITQYFSLENISIFGNCVIKIVQQKSTSGQLTIDNICFEYAEKPIIPFELKQVEQTKETIFLRYSAPIAQANIYTQPTEFLQNITIDTTDILIELNTALCGEFSVYITSVCDTSTSARYAADTSFAIMQFTPIQAQDIVVSEIMIAPSGEYGLPDYEYIELYNRSNCAVQLSDLELIAGANTYMLPDYILQSQSFVYIISSNAMAQITSHENVCFLKSFPALPNSGQTLALQTHEGKLVTSLTYSDEWYNSAFKKQGGWSIEKIDVNNLSELANNWRASESFKGGTPGAVNSTATLNPDITEPRIESVVVLNDTTLHIAANKALSSEMLLQYCSLSHNNSIRSIEHTDYKATQFTARLTNPLERSVVYQLFIDTNLSDYAGNTNTQDYIEFACADSLLTRGAVIFTEILFHASAAQEKFIELYNNSNSYFNCADIYLTNIDTANNDLKTIHKLSSEPLLFPPHTYAVASRNAISVQAQSACAGEALFLSPANMPALAQTKGTLLLANKWGQTIDSLCYVELWHSPYLAQKTDVSLERLDYQKPTNSASNWYSSAMSSEWNHSAGCENSHNRTQINKIGFSLEKPNVHPGEPLYEQAVLRYELPFNESHTLNVRIFSSSGVFVKHLANNLIPANNGSITWDCTNDHNEFVGAGIYIVAIELFRNGKKQQSEKLVCTVLR